MDKDRIAGVAHQIKGRVKEAIGKVTGDAKTRAEGAAEKAAGRVQNAVGGQGRRPGSREEVNYQPLRIFRRLPETGVRALGFACIL
jgi:uncharacterized protein YjbJ (UPF0337 family)